MTTPGASQHAASPSLRKPDPDGTAKGRLSGLRLRRAVEYMHANLAEGVRTEDVASATGLSTFHFARAFKRTTGLTPYRYLVMARVERVKDLLRKGETCLAEIALEAGFVDQSHMTNVFRRSTGVTPDTFRSARPGLPDRRQREGRARHALSGPVAAFLHEPKS